MIILEVVEIMHIFLRHFPMYTRSKLNDKKSR